MPPSRIDRRVFPEMFRVILPLAYAELSLENIFKADASDVCLKNTGLIAAVDFQKSRIALSYIVLPSRIDRRVFPEMFRVILPLAYAELS